MKNKKTIIYAFIFILAAVGLTYVFISRNNNENTGNNNPVMTTERGQTIDMSPGTEADNKEINEKKKPGGMDDVPTITDDIQITITRTSQDSANDLQVRTLLSGLTGGNCKLILTKDAVTIEKTAPISLQNTGYICDGFDIKSSEFMGNAGTWRLEMTVISVDNKTQSIQQDVIIKL